MRAGLRKLADRMAVFVVVGWVLALGWLGWGCCRGLGPDTRRAYEYSYTDCSMHAAVEQNRRCSAGRHARTESAPQSLRARTVEAPRGPDGRQYLIIYLYNGRCAVMLVRCTGGEPGAESSNL